MFGFEMRGDFISVAVTFRHIFQCFPYIVLVSLIDHCEPICVCGDSILDPAATGEFIEIFTGISSPDNVIIEGIPTVQWLFVASPTVHILHIALGRFGL